MPKTKQQSELHLFIIWEHGRSAEKQILNDISENFSILQTYEVTWPENTFSENLSRFYGTNLPPNSRKEQHCGTGPFLAVVVLDKTPIYASKTTSKGDQLVNTRLFDAKTRHREWTNGGHRVHGTNSVVEANHNCAMLFGLNAEDLRKKLEKNAKKGILSLERNLEGHEGWHDLRHLFYVLNATMPYVVLRNYEPFPDGYYSAEHGDIDLLVADRRDTAFITNASPVFKSGHRVHYKVRIGNEDVKFDFRSIGDGYYDISWQENIIANRRLEKETFYVPSVDDHFYSLLYHALVQKPAIAKDYAIRLLEVARANKVTLGNPSSNPTTAVKALAKFMNRNGYKFTQPKDKSVYVNAQTVKFGRAEGVSYARESLTPLRNHLKYAKSKSKHYLHKVDKLLKRNVRKIIRKKYE